MQHQTLRRTVRVSGLGCIAASLLALCSFSASAWAQGGSTSNPPSDQASPELKEAKAAAQSLDEEIIVITKKLPPKQQEKPAQGPPSKEKLIMDEARERLEWLKTMQGQLQQTIKQAEQAKNPAEAQVLAKDARLKAEAAEHLKQTITGPPPSALWSAKTLLCQLHPSESMGYLMLPDFHSRPENAPCVL